MCLHRDFCMSDMQNNLLCHCRPYLTNPDASERCKGTQLLQLLLHRLLYFKLREKEGNFEMTFTPNVSECISL